MVNIRIGIDFSTKCASLRIGINKKAVFFAGVGVRGGSMSFWLLALRRRILNIPGE